MAYPAAHNESRRSGARKRSRRQALPTPGVPTPRSSRTARATSPAAESTTAVRPDSPTRTRHRSWSAPTPRSPRYRRRIVGPRPSPTRASVVAVSSGVATRTIESGQASLGQRAGERQRRVPVAHHEGVRPDRLRDRRGPNDDIGQDAQPALGAQHDLPQVRAGGRGRMGRQVERSARRLEVTAGEESLDAPVAGRLLPGRASDHPAADRRALERLRVVSQGPAARREGGLQVRPDRAGTERREAARLVECPQARPCPRGPR